LLVPPQTQTPARQPPTACTRASTPMYVQTTLHHAGRSPRMEACMQRQPRHDACRNLHIAPRLTCGTWPQHLGMQQHGRRTNTGACVGVHWSRCTQCSPTHNVPYIRAQQQQHTHKTAEPAMDTAAAVGARQEGPRGMQGCFLGFLAHTNAHKPTGAGPPKTPCTGGSRHAQRLRCEAHTPHQTGGS
jgi:hypothetical protein